MGNGGLEGSIDTKEGVGSSAGGVLLDGRMADEILGVDMFGYCDLVLW